MIKIIAIFYIAMILLDKLLTPFFFGREREPYNPKLWLFGVLFIVPLLWLLFKVAIQ